MAPFFRFGINYPEVIGNDIAAGWFDCVFVRRGPDRLVWLVAGAVLHTGRPIVPGLLLVLPLRGEALAMEADVRELRRLQSRLPGARMVLVDCGLTEDARGLAQYLADREKRGELVDAAEFHLG